MEKTDKFSEYQVRDINNVVGSQYIINNPVIEINNSENINSMNLRFKELEKVDYLKILRETCSEKNIIYRERVIDDLLKLMANENEILVFGNPGIGKTVILHELSKKRDAVYISLRDKSLKRAINYIINSIEIDYAYDNTDDIINVLEIMLQASNKLFLIDDCESNPELLQQLLSLEKFNNIFVYASRNSDILCSYTIKDYEIKPFDKEEVNEFIKINSNTDTLGVVNFQDLFEISQGNPLYLYYFSRYQITPLPKDLAKYQQAIWNSINTDERELLSCIGITNFPISFDIMKNAYNLLACENNSPMKIVEKIRNVNFLLNIDEKNYEIFHPSFKEYIISELTKIGMIDYYKEKIGYVCLEKGDYIEATLLLRNIDNEKIEPHLFETAHCLYFWGHIELSAQILEIGLALYKKLSRHLEYGYTNYHLSNIYRDLGEKCKSYECIEEAIKCFKDRDKEQFYVLSLTFKAQFLAEDGNKNESMEVINNLLDNIPESKEVQATLYVNVSKTFLSFNQYKQAAKHAKMAYELFSSLKDKRGMTISILNYSACLGNLDEENLAIEYLEALLETNEIVNQPQIKAGILNNLTLCYRKNHKYKEAKKVCLESIDICRKLKLYEKVTMNLLNLGNVYRDEEEYIECEKVYKQGLEMAREYSFKREIGRAQELLANIYNLLERYDDAILYANEAIKESKSIKDSFRVAEAYIERAKAYEKLNFLELYVQDIDDAIKYYLDEGFLNYALYYLFKSAKINFQLNQLENVKNSLNHIKDMILNENEIDFIELLEHINNLREIDDNNALELYVITFNKYFVSNNNFNVLLPFIEFVTLCKDKIKCSGKQIIIDILNKIIGEINDNSKLIDILAFGIGQSGELLGFEDIKKIIIKVIDKIDGFYYRELSDGSGVFTIVCDEGFIVQINSAKLDIMEYKIALSIGLIIKNNYKLLCESVVNFKENTFGLYTLDYDTFNKQVTEITDECFPDLVSALFIPRENFGTPTVMVLHKDYVNLCDFSKNPNNKAFIWILMNLYQAIICHIEHITEKDITDNLAKDARRFVEKVTGINYEIEKKDRWRITEKL